MVLGFFVAAVFIWPGARSLNFSFSGRTRATRKHVCIIFFYFSPHVSATEVIDVFCFDASPVTGGRSGAETMQKRRQRSRNRPCAPCIVFIGRQTVNGLIGCLRMTYRRRWKIFDFPPMIYLHNECTFCVRAVSECARTNSGYNNGLRRDRRDARTSPITTPTSRNNVETCPSLNTSDNRVRLFCDNTACTTILTILH